MFEDFSYKNSMTGTSLRLNFDKFFSNVNTNSKFYLLSFIVLSIILLINYLSYISYMKRDDIDNKKVISYKKTLYIELALVLFFLFMTIISYTKYTKL
jgi:hypothetical protein